MNKKVRIWTDLFFALIITFSCQVSYAQTIVLTPVGQEQVQQLSDQQKLELETKRRQLLSRILSINDPETLKKLHDLFLVHDMARAHFVDSKTSPDLLDLAMTGMIGGLDPYSNLFIDSDAEMVTRNLSGENNFIGIGMSIENFYKTVVITEVFDGFPAARAGIEQGDILLKVNGESVFGMSVAKIASLIRGPEGTSVVLEIRAARFQKSRPINVVRQRVVVESVSYKNLKNNLAYIKVRSFRPETVERFSDALKKSSNKKGIIIDLRDNGGGSLDAVNQMVSLLVGPNKVLVSMKGRSTSSEVLTPAGANRLVGYSTKIVLLINNNSASASEIMAGNLKHYKVATLVGVRTFGKATAQNYLGLDNPNILESRLIVGITTARFYLPDGTNITGEGVQPDMEVEQPENFKRFQYLTRRDTQFQRALQLLRK